MKGRKPVIEILEEMVHENKKVFLTPYHLAKVDIFALKKQVLGKNDAIAKLQITIHNLNILVKKHELLQLDMAASKAKSELDAIASQVALLDQERSEFMKQIATELGVELPWGFSAETGELIKEDN